MKYGVRSLVVVLVAMLALTLCTYAQEPTGSAAAQASTSSSRTLDPAEEAARVATGKPLVDIEAIERNAVVTPQVTNKQTAVACNTCFTCGGDWPIFAGAVHAVNTGNLTSERGSGCSGTIHAANDQNPFLCCR